MGRVRREGKDGDRRKMEGERRHEGRQRELVGEGRV